MVEEYDNIREQAFIQGMNHKFILDCDFLCVFLFQDFLLIFYHGEVTAKSIHRSEFGDVKIHSLENDSEFDEFSSNSYSDI